MFDFFIIFATLFSKNGNGMMGNYVSEHRGILLALLLMAVCCGRSLAQEVTNAGNGVGASGVADSIRMDMGVLDSISPMNVRHSGLHDAQGAYGRYAEGSLDMLKAPRITVPMPVAPRPYLAAWDGGMLVGGHNSMGAHGIYYANEASVMAVHRIGDLQLQGTASLNKLATFHDVTNGASVDLTATYPLGRNVSVTGFGGVYQSGLFQPGGTRSYYYGGYVTLLTNNKKWGADLGVRRVYNPYTGSWETIPVAMPYYNLHGAKLGFDFGGLIYHFLQSAKEAKMQNDVNRGPNIVIPTNQKVEIRPIEVPNRYKDQ